MRKLKDLEKFGEKIYIRCVSDEDLEMFIEQAEKENINFGDGVSLRERKPDNLMVFEKGEICYPAGMTYVFIKSNYFKRIIIDFRKYIEGKKRFFYRYPRTVIKKSAEERKKEFHESLIRKKNEFYVRTGYDYGLIDGGRNRILNKKETK